VYDDLRGWDTELYLGPSEFYNNFGRFDVRIDVPAGWIVSHRIAARPHSKASIGSPGQFNPALRKQ
jgi:hypothetical protein